MRLWGCPILVLFLASLVVCQTDNPSTPKTTANADDNKSEREFDPFLPRQVAQKLLLLNDLDSKSEGLARLADLIWKYDQDYARSLFERAITLTTPQERSNDTKLLVFQRTVIRIIARKDPEWAKRLLDAQQIPDITNRNFANLNAATSLIDQDIRSAVDFAQRGLQEQLSPAFLHFLLTLRKKDQARADEMFVQILIFLEQQQRPDIKGFHSIGVYLFTSPDLIDTDFYAITLVDNILVPNITVQRRNVSPALVRAYLKTASILLLRASTDPSQQQEVYALGHLLLPKAKDAAPDLIQQIEAAMSAVSSSVPPSLTDDSAYKYINSLPPTPEESFANADRKPNRLEKDMALLGIAARAYRNSDFPTARKAASLIFDVDASRALTQVIDFGEAAFQLERASFIEPAEKAAYKLPPGLERTILLLAVANSRVKIREREPAEEAIDASLKATTAVTDLRRACLNLIAASYLAQLRSSIAPVVTSAAIKELNSFDKADYSEIDWTRTVEIGPLKLSFSLTVSSVDLNLDHALRAVLASDLETGFARAQEIRNESLRARALVEFVAAYLDELEKRPKPTKPQTEKRQKP